MLFAAFCLAYFGYGCHFYYLSHVLEDKLVNGLGDRIFFIFFSTPLLTCKVLSTFFFLGGKKSLLCRCSKGTVIFPNWNSPTLCLSIVYGIIYKSVSNCRIVLLIDSEDSNFHSATQDWKSTCAQLSVSLPHPQTASKIRFRCRLRACIYLRNMRLIKYLYTINITVSIRIIIMSCQSGAEFCFRETKQFKL